MEQEKKKLNPKIIIAIVIAIVAISIILTLPFSDNLSRISRYLSCVSVNFTADHSSYTFIRYT